MLAKRSLSPVKSSSSTPVLAKRSKTDDNESHGSNIKVCVRLRPFSEKELQNKQENLVLMDLDGQVTHLKPPAITDPSLSLLGISKRKSMAVQAGLYQSRSFKFDRSLWSFDSKNNYYVDQQGTYDKIGKEYLLHTLDGYNTCIFSYGQTGSGKSYTMMGTEEEPGLIPLICKDLFTRSEKLLNEKQISVTVKISYFEIYNEYVYDLLNIPDLQPNQQQRQQQDRRLTMSRQSSRFDSGVRAGTSKTGLQKLKVRESPEFGPYVENLSEFPVKNYEEVSRFFSIGNANRKTASTKMNISSSRSHAIFTISVKQIEYSDILADKILNVKKSTLRLIDLAGSERANSTGTAGQRLKEGNNINKSLVCLGRVINALARANTTTSPPGSSTGPLTIPLPSPSRLSSRSSLITVSKTEKLVIPYRDSTLTWILKESLGGNSRTAMIACISPCDYEETLSTLRYANNAKKIKTEAKINQDEDSKISSDLSNQVKVMQNKIKELEAELAKKTESQKAEKEKEIIQATQNKISNNYKKYLKFYEEKLIDQESKNRIFINEINKLRTENLELNNSINSIIGPILNENYIVDGDESLSNELEEINNIIHIKNKKLQVNLKRSNKVNFATLAPVKSPKKASSGIPSPIKQPLSPIKQRLAEIEGNKENSNITLSATKPLRPTALNGSKPSLLPLLSKTKIKKLNEIVNEFDQLKSDCKAAEVQMQNELKKFQPLKKIVSFSDSEDDA